MACGAWAVWRGGLRPGSAVAEWPRRVDVGLLAGELTPICRRKNFNAQKCAVIVMTSVLSSGRLILMTEAVTG